MIEALNRWDWRVFEWINSDTANIFFDHIMPFLRQAYFWVPAYLFIALFAVLYLGRAALPFLIAFIFVFFYSDLMAAALIKPLVARIRPCQASEGIRLLVNCGAGYSFPSAHAANHFGISFFLYYTLHDRIPRLYHYIIIIWAVAVAYAQVYVGVHFPLDVLMGGLIGILIARFVSWYYLTRAHLIL